MKKLLFLLILLFLEVNHVNADETWKPPIGIPVPPFGINETYRMYDSEPNRSSLLTYYESSSGGYYTSYVDPCNSAATNSGNTYGTESKPRKTIPSTLPAGSVCEVHHVLKALNKYQSNITSQGTETYPVFIRGINNPVSEDTSPTTGHRHTIQFFGSYLVFEGFRIYNGSLTTYNNSTEKTHIVIRGNDVAYIDSSSGGNGITINGNSSYTVIYNNNIHNNGNIPINSSYDVHGIKVWNNQSGGIVPRYTWIINNQIYQNDGDGVQLGETYTGTGPEYTYIGYNIMYGDRQYGVTLKESNHTIISQNTVYGYKEEDRIIGINPNPRPLGTNADTAGLYLGNNNAYNSWTLFNDIYDCTWGMKLDNEGSDCNAYVVGNIVHDISDSGFFTYSPQCHPYTYFVFNTFYNVNKGFYMHHPFGGTHQFYNNIFSGCATKWIDLADENTIANVIAKNNIFFNGGGLNWGKDTYSTVSAFMAGEPSNTGNKVIDPLYVDPENHDFNLQDGSPVNDLETCNEAQAILNLFFQLYGIDLSEDIDGVPRVNGSNNVPNIENPESADSVPTDNSSDTGINDNTNDPVDESSNPVEESGSSDPGVTVSPENITPLPMIDKVEIIEVDSSDSTYAGFSTIDPLFSTSNAGLHVRDDKIAKVKTIKVRGIFNRYDDLYCLPKKNMNYMESFE
ncbi:MAG: DUF5123 domain-containing protein [Sedimentisphaerales bacterium]|nr:DUF5123 domain-containing protein [Sedimentisphaerales bacterium]